MRPRYQLDPIDPWVESNIIRPEWMGELIRRWMYNPPKLSLREWFHYDSREGIRLVRTVESPS